MISGIVNGERQHLVRIGRLLALLLYCLAAAVPVLAQVPQKEAETNALAEVRGEPTEGLFTVQPWVQLLDPNRLGVGWITAEPADGVVEWTQEDAGDSWREAWYSQDGLRQANGTAQRAVIEGYDPSKPIRFRARSRAITSFKPYSVTFGEPLRSQERRLPALAHAQARVSFIVFNDVHNRVQNYPLLVDKAGGPFDFAVFNGDVLQDPQTEKEVIEHLLRPMAWFTAKSAPCFFLRGNHETRGAFARALRDYLVLPEGRYYTAMTFGVTRVVFLDTGEDKPDTSKEYSGLVDFEPYIEQELAWLKREIASDAFQKTTWRIVVMHVPPDWRKPEADLWHGERRVREKFRPLLDAGHVTAVISGHNHKADLIEPCPDTSRGFQWPVFIGGAPQITNATVIRVEADATSLRIARFHSDGTVGAERKWGK